MRLIVSSTASASMSLTMVRLLMAEEMISLGFGPSCRAFELGSGTTRCHNHHDSHRSLRGETLAVLYK